MDYVNQFARLLNSSLPRAYIFNAALLHRGRTLSHHSLFSARLCASLEKRTEIRKTRENKTERRHRQKEKGEKENKHFVSRYFVTIKISLGPGDFASSLNRKPQAYARRIILIILQCEKITDRRREKERKRSKREKERPTVKGFEAR